MRAFWMLLAAFWPALAPAQGDWLNVAVPHPLTDTAVEIGLRAASFESYTWANGWAQADSLNHSTYLLDSTGDTLSPKAARRLELALQLRWKAWKDLVVDLDVPQVYTAFEPNYYDSVVPAPGDPEVDQGAGLGDIRLGLRGPWSGVHSALQAGWSLGLIAPTGIGPLDAQQALVATGDGRWQLQPGLVLGAGQGSSVEFWLQAQGRWQFGAPGRVSPALRLSYAGSLAGGGYYALAPSAQGAVWLDPRWGGDGSLGLGWNWYSDADSRQTLAVELLGHWLSPWSMDGMDQGFGAESSVQLQPELHARFGRFSVLGGWRSAVLYGTNVLVQDWGQVLLDGAYAF